jgi:peptide/nickel transport system permease protein
MNAPAGESSVAVVEDLAPISREFESDLARAGANVRSRRGMAWFLAKRYPLGAIGLAIVVGFVLVAIFAPYLAPSDPLSTNPSRSL